MKHNKPPDVFEFVCTKLQALAINLGFSIASVLELECVKCLPVAKRVLTNKYHKRFAESYHWVASDGDFMGWI